MAQTMNLIKASNLRDTKVKNKANEDLGKIDDFVIFPGSNP